MTSLTPTSRGFTDPVPLDGVVAFALPPLGPRPAGSFPGVSPVAPFASSVLQQLHHLALVDGIDTLRESETAQRRRAVSPSLSRLDVSIS